jgi:carboxymethylenebutenolidase
VAIAPDLYHGELAEYTEVEKAKQLAESLDVDRAVKDLGFAIDYLKVSERKELF